MRTSRAKGKGAARSEADSLGACGSCRRPLNTYAERALGECDKCVHRVFNSDWDEAMGIPRGWYLDDARHGIPPLPGSEVSEAETARLAALYGEPGDSGNVAACPTCWSWRHPLTTAFEQAVGMCSFCVSFGSPTAPNGDPARERLRQAAVTVAAFADSVARATTEMPQDRVAPLTALLEEMAARTIAHGANLTKGAEPSTVAAHTLAITLDEVTSVPLPGIADVVEQARLRRGALSLLLLREPTIAAIEARWPVRAFPGLRLDPALVDAALDAAAGRGAVRKKDAVAALVSHALGRKFSASSFAVDLSKWRKTPAGQRVAGDVRLTAKIAVYEAARAQS
jgi:hypothetical protein